jgi:hypothetical protein
MPQSPEAFYRERLQTLESEYDATQSRSTTLLLLPGVIALVASLFVFIAAYHHTLPLWPLAVPVLALAGLAPPWIASRRTLARLSRLITLYHAAVARITHQPAESPQTGEAFRSPDHIFDRDLNILGPNSLFALLATTRTGLGQRALAKTLLDPPPLAESRQRQQTIRTLTPNTGLRERIALLGPSVFTNIQPDSFEPWLDESPVQFPRILVPILYLTSTIALVLAIAWFLGRLPNETFLPNLAAVLGLQAAIALLYRPRALPILEATQPRPGQIQILRDGLALLDTPPAGADKALTRLQNLLYLVEQRKTEWCYLPCLLLNTGTHAAIRINQWKLEHAPALRQWLAAWAEFDALNAFATYAFDHPENTYPDLIQSPTPLFEATALTHPLLPNAVPNNVTLSPETRFYLISGSNMAGKSTLLRSIGLAVVLARAGAPVPAQHCRLTPLTLGASLTPTDSLTEGKSRFLAEVHRLQQILAAARVTPTLFLIDELFSGTNSADRLTAAEAVLKALLATGAIGALSTHDLALTTLATEANAGQNVHMASPDPTDPLAFDYLLKPGVNTHTNALAFLKLLQLDE